MPLRLIQIISLLYLSIFSAQAEELLLTAKDGFQLNAQYHNPGAGQNRGVLLLHQCNLDQTMYQHIGPQLAMNGVHAISLDFRGFGKSINEQFNFAKIVELDESTQQQALSEMYQHWPADVLTVLDYLQDRVGEVGTIGVVGASCGGSLAVRLSDTVNFSAVALFSSAQGEKNIMRYENNLRDLPTYLIAAEGDNAAYHSAEQIFALANHLASKKVTYKGARHGYPLFQQDDGAQQALIKWLVQNLN
jgi:dienelactone hydrolase